MTQCTIFQIKNITDFNYKTHMKLDVIIYTIIYSVDTGKNANVKNYNTVLTDT